MYKGDLSNEVPKRIVVTTDLFITTEVTEHKKRFRVKRSEKREVSRAILSRLYLFAQKTPYSLECVSFDMNDESLTVLLETLEKAGTNPFNFFTSYESIKHLVNDLPLRPEVLAVVDKPTRLLMYGHWGRNLNEL